MTSRGGGRGAAGGGEFLNPCGAGRRPVVLPHKYLWPLITGSRSLSRSVAPGSSAELSVPGCTRFQSSARLAGMAHTFYKHSSYSHWSAPLRKKKSSTQSILGGISFPSMDGHHLLGNLLKTVLLSFWGVSNAP